MKIFRFNLSHPNSSGYKKATTADEDIISAILLNDNATIGTVYREYYHKIKKMVYTFHNSSLNPDDVFQEGLLRAITSIREGKFRGESSFLTYFSGICRNICLKELDRRHSGQTEYKEIPDEKDESDFDRHDRLQQVKNLLPEKCRMIIDLRYRIDDDESGKTTPFDEVAAILNLTPENARQSYKRCLDKLREYAMKDDVLKSLYYS